MKKYKALRKTTLITLILSLFLVLSLSFTQTVNAAPSTWVRQGNTTQKVVALTFDNGSDGTNFNKIVDTLAKHNVKATFFLTGQGTESHPSFVRRMASQGHDIGNHAYDHPDFTKISASQMQSQLSRTETAVKNVTGRTTKPYFRAPYGATNSAVLQTVGNAGYTHTFHWSIDTLDWQGHSATYVSNRVINNIHPGAIVLMHTGAGASGTPQALERMIPALKNQGYRFVTVSQLLNRPGQGTGTGTTHTVQRGETLSVIARRYGITVNQLAQANNITNVNLIRVGQVLRIPGKTTPTPPPAPVPSTTNYTVKRGDTLYSIATRHRTTVAQLVRLNNLSNANLIRVGQVIKVPRTTPTPPPATTTRHTVRAGETLYGIARRYNTTVAQLVQANNLSNANFLRIGQVLTIR